MKRLMQPNTKGIIMLKEPIHVVFQADCEINDGLPPAMVYLSGDTIIVQQNGKHMIIERNEPDSFYNDLYAVLQLIGGVPSKSAMDRAYERLVPRRDPDNNGTTLHCHYDPKKKSLVQGESEGWEIPDRITDFIDFLKQLRSDATTRILSKPAPSNFPLMDKCDKTAQTMPHFTLLAKDNFCLPVMRMWMALAAQHDGCREKIGEADRLYNFILEWQIANRELMKFPD
jgi:hypothetical protein